MKTSQNKNQNSNSVAKQKPRNGQSKHVSRKKQDNNSINRKKDGNLNKRASKNSGAKNVPKTPKKPLSGIQKREATLNKIQSILAWDFNLPIRDRGFDSNTLEVLSSTTYGDHDTTKSRKKTFLDSAMAKDIIKLRTYSSLRNKLKDETNVLKSDEQIVRDFRDVQNSIPYIEDFSVERLKSVFEKYVVFDPDSYCPVLNEDLPYIITSGVSFPAKVFPRMDAMPQELSNLLYIVEYGSSEESKLMSFKTSQRELTTLRGGLYACKLSLVPKNYKTKREIGIPSREAICQTWHYNNAMRKLAISLNTDHSVISFAQQSIQQLRILETDTSSVDLSAASERVSLALITRLSPILGEYVRDTIPEFINTDLGRVKLNSCGPQGFPLVFTIMAILTKAIAECYTDASTKCSNYGDDLIIDAEYEQVTAALEVFGLKVNSSKSYNTNDSSFSESCGVDALKDQHLDMCHDITPVYLRKVNDTSIISFINNCIGKDLLTSKQILSLANLCEQYVIYPYTYQTSAFHINYDFCDEVDKKIIFKGFVPKQARKYQVTHLLCPDLYETVEVLHGLPRKESSIILNVIDIWEDIKINGVCYNVLEMDKSITYVNHELDPNYAFIIACDGLKGYEDLIPSIQYYFTTLNCDHERIIAFLKVYMGYGYLFKGSFESFNPQDSEQSNTFRDKVNSWAGVTEPNKLPLGKVLQRKRKTWVPIPEGYSL